MIGYAYVCADLLHVGHINHLEACKALCDKLVVGVLTDKAVMEKKPKPIIPFEERLRTVQALKCVDIAVSQETYSPLKNAIAMKVDIIFESTSHLKEAIDKAREKAGSYGARVIVMPYYGMQSSSEIKLKVKKLK